MRMGKKNKVEDFITLLAVVQNPQTKDPKKLYRELQGQVTKLKGIDNSELDKEGLKRLKEKMNKDNEILRKTE
jgi:hypothetical protein